MGYSSLSLIPRSEILVKTLCGFKAAVRDPQKKLQEQIMGLGSESRLMSNTAFVDFYHSFPKWILGTANCLFSPCPSGIWSIWSARETVPKKCFFLPQGRETLLGGLVCGNCGRRCHWLDDLYVASRWVSIGEHTLSRRLTWVVSHCIDAMSLDITSNMTPVHSLRQPLYCILTYLQIGWNKASKQNATKYRRARSSLTTLWSQTVTIVNAQDTHPSAVNMQTSCIYFRTNSLTNLFIRFSVYNWRATYHCQFTFDSTCRESYFDTGACQLWFWLFYISMLSNTVSGNTLRRLTWSVPFMPISINFPQLSDI